jgi:hypothetical protein
MGPNLTPNKELTKGRQFGDAIQLQLNTVMLTPETLTALKITSGQARAITSKLAQHDHKAKVVDAVDGGLSSVTVRLPQGAAVPDKPVSLKISRDQVVIQVGAGDDANKTSYKIETLPYARKAFDGPAAVAKKASGPAP